MQALFTEPRRRPPPSHDACLMKISFDFFHFFPVRRSNAVAYTARFNWTDLMVISGSFCMMVPVPAVVWKQGWEVWITNHFIPDTCHYKSADIAISSLIKCGNHLSPFPVISFDGKCLSPPAMHGIYTFNLIASLCNLSPVSCYVFIWLLSSIHWYLLIDHSFHSFISIRCMYSGLPIKPPFVPPSPGQVIVSYQICEPETGCCK